MATHRDSKGIMPDISNQQLVEKARRGDHGALGRLLQNHQLRLFNVVLRMVGQRDDAAEVTQDVMVKVVEHIGDFRGQSDISTWMIRIAMNLSFSWLRKQRLRRTSSLDTPKSNAGGQFREDQLTPLRQQLADAREPQPHLRVQQTEMLERLHDCMNRLQDDLRAVLVLRDIDQMAYDRIADVLAIRVGTVKSRLFRARLALRHEMTQLDCTHRSPQNDPRSSDRFGHDEKSNQPQPDRTMAPKEFNDD